VAPLIAGHTPSSDAVARAWEHYKAERFVDAQREFALASLHEREVWKHPFNLACASARAEDEAMTRIALAEAHARAPERVAAKARKDADLAAYRDAPWFSAALGDVAMRGDVATREVDEALDPSTLTSIPPPPDAQPLPSGTATPLSKAELGRVRKALAAELGLAPSLRGSLALDAAGQPIAFIVYDFTERQACKAEAAGDREALALCIDDLEPSSSERSEMGNRTECVQQFLIRVELGATIVLGKPIELEVACDASEVRRLDAVDLDADGRLEVVLDTIGAKATTDMFGAPALNRAHQLVILGLDGVVHYQLAIAADAELPFLVVTRVFVRDDDGDGHLDLIEQKVSEFDDMQCAPLLAADDFWPSCNPMGWEQRRSETLVLRYDPATDTWLAPAG